MAAAPHNLREHVELQSFNTLALPARARYFVRAESVADVAASIAWSRAQALPLLVLGGGSNVVLRGDWPGLVLQMAVHGRHVELVGDHALLTVGAGENWHELVQWSLREHLYGLENLTLIPGTAGAAPVQNIGAYGVELHRVLECVRGFVVGDNANGELVELGVAQCELGYRDSIFKRALRDRFVIVEVVLRLARTFAPVVDYPALAALLDDGTVDAERIERTVRELRQSKLPDPVVLPNAGSFFKNPVIDARHFAELRARHPDIPSFAAPGGIKVPAAWLVERSGWKGRRVGDVGVHDRQSLVLANYAGRAATAGVADRLLELAAAIQADVSRLFAVALEIEPAVYGDRTAAANVER